MQDNPGNDGPVDVDCMQPCIMRTKTLILLHVQ